jgi:hypothetical protein
MTVQEKKPSTQKQSIEPVDIARRVLIWQWVLNPKEIIPPSDLTKEELVEVYHSSRESLSKFTDAISRIGQMQDQKRIL